jgi:hypothetical protein
LYSSPSIVRMIKSGGMRSAGHVAQIRPRKHIGYCWESQREGELGRLRSRSVDDINMHLGKIGWGGVDWSGSG